jgi:hypothetical protein
MKWHVDKMTSPKKIISLPQSFFLNGQTFTRKGKSSRNSSREERVFFVVQLILVFSNSVYVSKTRLRE